MPAYDSQKFDPPAPVAHITLRNSETGATWSDVLMLLDFGADVTMIPQAAAGLLGLTVDLDKTIRIKGIRWPQKLCAGSASGYCLCTLDFQGTVLAD
jgi:hypothetical protein